jgi:cyclophilin family peptidyl-prolyl cis-trans isomerase
MTIPPISRLKPDGKTVEFVPGEDQAYAGIRAWVDRDIVFHTTMGDMRFAMRPDCAPNTVWTIMHLVSGGFYRDVIWHRVVALSHGFPFVIQGGDPTGTGNGGPGFDYPLEDSPLPHDLGVISIARDADPNTNGCQIFVCLSREGTARLDHKYASFGQCIAGIDVVKKIGAVPVGKEDRPLVPPVIHSAELVDATPRVPK